MSVSCKRWSLICIGIFILSGCASTVNTLPPLTSPEEPAKHYALVMPESLEVVSVDFDIALYSDAEEGTPTYAEDLGGRSFVGVYAVHQETGEQYLLLYENLQQRARPATIIEFEASSEMDLR